MRFWAKMRYSKARGCSGWPTLTIDIVSKVMLVVSSLCEIYGLLSLPAIAPLVSSAVRPVYTQYQLKCSYDFT